MKKRFILPILFTALLFSFFACSDSNGEKETNPLVGCWHTATSNRITSLRIDENGAGEATVYKFDGSEWKCSTKLLQYTIDNNLVTIKIEGENAISCLVAVTGTSLSFSIGDNVFMFTNYNGNEASIKNLQKNIENNYIYSEGSDGSTSDDTFPDTEDSEDIIILPTDNIITENFWISQAGVDNFLATIYIKSISFTIEQLNLEQTRITGKNLAGHNETITATSQDIENCWTAAYSAINHCNTMIEHAPEEYFAAINEAKALRCFLYYNIAHLWGKAPYITSTNDIAASTSQVLNKEQIFDNILKEINSIGQFRTTESQYSNYYIDNETLQMIKGEIYMARGMHNEALDIFRNSAPTFSLSLEGNHENYQTFFGKEIQLYTAEITLLLANEACGEIDTTIQEWQAQRYVTYGYWAMLKRTSKALEITGCKEYELLLPIPNSEILRNRNITQNPGY